MKSTGQSSIGERQKNGRGGAVVSPRESCERILVAMRPSPTETTITSPRERERESACGVGIGQKEKKKK